jgi:hypothetical protein
VAPSVRSNATEGPAHDLLFTVYALQDDAKYLGVGRCGDDAFLIEGPSGAMKVRKVRWADVVAAIALRSRQGYRPLDGGWFFNPQSQSFTVVHSDLQWQGAKVVLMSRQETVAASAELLAAIVRSTPTRCIRGEEVNGWLDQQRRNAAHVVAFDDHPVWALALAEMVLTKGWDWRVGPQLTAPPPKRPSLAPTEWMQWLSQRFQPKAVYEAQAGLGWTAEALINSDKGVPTEGSLSALL